MPDREQSQSRVRAPALCAAGVPDLLVAMAISLLTVGSLRQLQDLAIRELGASEGRRGQGDFDDSLRCTRLRSG